jgi:heavy metal sensor kinase
MFSNKPSTATRTVVARLTWRYLLICSIFCVAVFTLVSVRLKSSAFKRIDHVLADELNEFANLYREEGMPGLTEEFSREIRATGAEELFCRLISLQGQVLLASDLSRWEGLDEQLADLRPDTPGIIRLDTIYPGKHPLNARVASVHIEGAGILQLGMTLERENSSHQRTRRILAGASLMMILLSTCAGLLIARQAMAGVRRVTDTVSGIRRDNLSHRVPPGNEGLEINELAEAFNRMLQRIEMLIREIKDVSDNVAHDLRSPITRMRGIAETTLTGPQDVDNYREMGLTILEECDRLTEIINTMLEIARSESGVLEMARAEVDFTELLNGALELFRPVAEEKNIQLTADLPEHPLMVLGDKSRLQRVIANLLDNALKYTPDGGSVLLTALRSEHAIEISIRDSGIGLEPQEARRIFERFYRCEKSRSTPGNGLGLSLAKSIVVAHGGKLDVESVPNIGSTFTIKLPAD